MPFGDYDAGASPSVEPGVYDAIIETASIAFDNGKPKVNESGKTMFDVGFTLDADTKLRRRYSIAFGQNKQNGQWAAFAKLLEAATGVKCGDPAQRELDDSDLVSKRVRIVVETNDRGYSDVTNVLPAARSNARPEPRQPVAAGATRPRAGGEAHHDDAGFSDDDFAGYERR